MIYFTRVLQYALFLIFSSVCSAYTLRGSIAKSALPLSSDDLSSTTIRLISKSTEVHLPFYETYLKRNGEFTFTNVSPGSYLLSLDSVSLATDASLRVTVSPSQIVANKIFPGHDWETDVGPQVDYPIVFETIGRPEYVVEREKFSAMSMIKSPMVLLTLGSLAMVFVLPKMVDNLGEYLSSLIFFAELYANLIDPEALKAMQQPGGQVKSPDQAWQELKKQATKPLEHKKQGSRSQGQGSRKR